MDKIKDDCIRDYLKGGTSSSMIEKIKGLTMNSNQKLGHFYSFNQ
jgi:hypothetical protein